MKRDAVVAGVLDIAFVAGAGLYGYGLWRLFPDWAPLVGGTTLMGLAVAANVVRQRRLNAS